MTTDKIVPLALLSAPTETGVEPLPNEMINDRTVELGIPPSMTHLMSNCTLGSQQAEQGVLLQIGPSQTKQAVIDKEDRTFTPQQIKSKWPEVQAAMMKELQTWAKLKCFSRRPRKGATNIIDVRWVVGPRWEVPTANDLNNAQRTGYSKMAQDNQRSTTDTSHQKKGEKVMSIRARLTVRGFKDRDKGEIDIFILKN